MICEVCRGSGRIFWLREAWFWVARRPWYWLRERLWPSPARPDDGTHLHGLREDLSELIYSMPPASLDAARSPVDRALAEWRAASLKEKR